MDRENDVAVDIQGFNGLYRMLVEEKMAGSEGFEPPEELPPR